MFLRLQKQIQDLVSAHCKSRYAMDAPVSLAEPTDAAFGELSFTTFALAKALRGKPRSIAEEIVRDMGAANGVAAMEVAGGGYINIRLDRSAYASAVLTGAGEESSAGPGKIIVEHTNINPNKAAHVGHLRNAVLGDTFVRMQRAMGYRVETQNYIDNTGVQVADVVAGFHFLEKMSLAEVANLISRPRFDYVCWDAYARVSQHYGESKEDEKAWRHETLHGIESGAGELSEMGHLIADAIVGCHLDTMARIGVRYDVLPRESEILHLQFWATAFEQLKSRGAIYLETEGKKAGCWVMAGEHFKETSEDDDSKVIVRSNGTVTYVGKDIAYQLWKFGLLGKDFHYRRLRTEADGHEVWVSTDDPSDAGAPEFGNGSTVYNVIDSRQSYLQDVVQAGLRALGYPEQAERSVHFSYEMVVLSPRTCAELGFELDEQDRARTHVSVSGRKGLGVKADDLIDKLIGEAQKEVDSRNAEQPAGERRNVAEAIAVGALRYFMLKFTRSTVIAFDLQEALSFTGDAGPYVQYAAVRAAKILREFTERGGAMPDFTAALGREALERQLANEDFWQLVLALSKVDVAIARAVSAGEPSHVAKYAFQLAQSFASFYHDYPVIHERDPEKQAFLLWLTSYFRKQLTRALDVLGIPVPEYM